jgi:hypothetical protein
MSLWRKRQLNIGKKMTITLTREEAKQVLDALANAAWCVQHNNLPPDDGHDWDKELELLRVRLSAPEPEPVAWKELTTAECKMLWRISEGPRNFAEMLQGILKEKNAPNL